MNVKDRQCLLTFLKKADGTPYYTGALDGIAGPLTGKALRDFQQDFGITGQGEEAVDLALRHGVYYGMPAPEEQTGAAPEDFWQETEFFAREEFRCKCGGKYCNGYPHEIQPLLVRLCDRARRWSGHPIQVISGLRCQEWNRIQKGVANSQHMYGEAVDVYFYGVSANAALEWLQSQPEVRYAYRIEGCNNIHFDIEPVGR